MKNEKSCGFGLALTDSSLLRQHGLIGGQWLTAAGAATFPVHNAATGELLAEMPLMGVLETQQAIAAAVAAFNPWRRLLAKERSEILRRWYELIIENLEDLALILTAEQGKPLAEARAEVRNGANHVQWHGEEAKRIYGDTVPANGHDRRFLVIRQPIGVCAAITPWNFPSSMITRKIAAAIAVGCTVVVKPAEQTPLSAMALAELAQRAGVPAGVLNVITGEPQVIGAELCKSNLVRKLSFTGSTEVGRLLMMQCAGNIKKLSLELGGNAPFIIFNDADINAAVAGVLSSKFRNAGQTCVCANRIYVQDDIYDAFTERFSAAVAKLQVGNGHCINVDVGPLINAAALSKVEALIADAVAQGAQIRVGGQRHALGGNFFLPTVLTNVDNSMRVAREETFGPLAPLIRFHHESEAVAMANDTEYGLAAYFYTRDMSRSFRVSEALEYGMVAVNTGVASSEAMPFGGVKQSGLGREGSRYGVDEYLELKSVCIAGLNGASDE